MKNLILLSFIVTLSACKTQKYKLESNSDLSLKSGFYIEIPPAIFEGKSSTEATIILNNFNVDDIVLKGFYFRNKFIKYKALKSPYALKGSVILDGINAKKVPFDIKNYEVVVSYQQNKKEKHVKFSLKRKENSLNNIPMKNNN